MNLPSLFSFAQKNKEYVTWGLSDGLSSADVNDAVVTATLYQGRESQNVDVKPGVPMPGCNGILLAYVAASKGIYRTVVDASAWPIGSYTLVIDATTPGGALAHWEKAAEVRPRNN